MLSLKAFHVLFIIASTALCFGFGAWALQMTGGASTQDLRFLGMLSMAGGVVLLIYGVWFLKKIGKLKI